jgi:hypothetical protein
MAHRRKKARRAERKLMGKNNIKRGGLICGKPRKRGSISLTLAEVSGALNSGPGWMWRIPD